MGFFLAPLLGALGSAGTAAAVSGAASLVGGALSRRDAKKATREQNAYNDPAQIRARAEAAGFNPLLWAGQGNIQGQPRASGFMGNAIANAGLAVAEGMTEQKRLDLEKTKLKMDRERLDKLIETQTIRPKVGGVYAQNVQTRSIKKTGAPLMTGTPNTSTRPPVIPTYDHPEKPELLSDPTTVMRDDGLPSANPDAPAEMEADLWDAARDGTLINFGLEIYKRNTMSPWQRQNWENTKKKAKETIDNTKETYKDIFERPRKKGAKLPKVDFPSYLPSISN